MKVEVREKGKDSSERDHEDGLFGLVCDFSNTQVVNPVGLF